MKKIILMTAAVFTFGFVNAQEGAFKIGAHVGLPTGDAKTISSVNVGADVAYTWNVGEGFDAGITTGYSTFIGKTVDFGFGSTKVPNYSFMPVAATAEYGLGENMFIGADLGYAVYVGSDGGKGGVYYQPKVGYKMDKLGIYVGYKGISVDGGSLSAVALGISYKL